ncbi:hypothetical protein ZIOFF_012031 [Zingiber officinale]|uniref:Dolichyl-diphosphooligosaccharide--protein glycosyltransferase subunit 1 n=1 Tax=Zingiber officinale TaxID=94328 RepID=A0A8J5M059_ZINOF|nr:hypothetical protein ZIOFF_012031 [Zingiber officinale]
MPPVRGCKHSSSQGPVTTFEVIGPITSPASDLQGHPHSLGCLLLDARRFAGRKRTSRRPSIPVQLDPVRFRTWPEISRSGVKYWKAKTSEASRRRRDGKENEIRGRHGDRSAPPPLLLSFTPICLFYAGDSSPQRGEKDRLDFANRKGFLDFEGTSDVNLNCLFFPPNVENYGAPEVPEILIAFSPTESEHLAILKASTVEGKRKKKTYVPLSVSPVSSPDAPNGAQLYSVTLRSPLQSGEMTTVETLYVLTHSLEPFPTEISQSEPQLVYYRDSATILSPYTIVEQTVYIKTPSSKVESYTKVEPTARSGSETRYGPYHDRLPYSFSPVIVHFENNNPFAVVEELVREIEISHWGNLQIRDHYRLKHAGARHKGVFSRTMAAWGYFYWVYDTYAKHPCRLDYQFRQSLSASFKTLLAMLPPRVHSVYYRDDIGNISSSHLRINSQKSELEIEPRYPLFGGWKATFTIGYGLPLQDFLFESSDGRRYLNFSFGCPLIETVVDDLTVKVSLLVLFCFGKFYTLNSINVTSYLSIVILPEGSRNPTAAVPFPVNQHLETTYSYLDVVGRTTLVLQKRNVVPEHNYPFQVYYDFNPIFMLAEPLMLVSSVFLFFVAYIAYVHIDLSIRRPLKTNS